MIDRDYNIHEGSGARADSCIYLQQDEEKLRCAGITRGKLKELFANFIYSRPFNE